MGDVAPERLRVLACSFSDLFFCLSRLALPNVWLGRPDYPGEKAQNVKILTFFMTGGRRLHAKEVSKTEGRTERFQLLQIDIGTVADIDAFDVVRET